MALPVVRAKRTRYPAIEDRYEIQETLGAGEYCMVHLWPCVQGVVYIYHIVHNVQYVQWNLSKPVPKISWP